MKQVTHAHCSVYQCGALYEYFNKYSPCPKCGISEFEITEAGTNDREAIREFFARRIKEQTRKNLGSEARH